MSLILRSLASDNVLYSFQDAFTSFSNTTHDIHGSNVITLFSSGCLVGNGFRDCSAVCQDPSLIFENTATLHNCLHYPSIVQAVSEQALDHGNATVARDYGIFAANASGATSAANAIQQCLTDYASSTPKASQYSLDLCSGSTPSLCYSHTNICESVYAPVIEDIAGIGASVVSPVTTVSTDVKPRSTLLTGCRMA